MMLEMLSGTQAKPKASRGSQKQSSPCELTGRKPQMPHFKVPRDSRGWRVPKAGTKALRVYRLMVAGKSLREIHDAVGENYHTVGVRCWEIRNADLMNKRRREG